MRYFFIIFLNLQVSISSAQTNERLANFFASNPCLYPMQALQYTYLPTELEKIKSTIGMLRASEEMNASKPSCLKSPPPIDQIRFVTFKDQDKVKSVVQVTATQGGHSSFAIITSGGKKIKLDEKYIGLAQGHGREDWQAVISGVNVFPGKYEFQWRDHAKHSIPFLFCMDIVSTDILAAHIVRVGGDNSKYEVNLELKESRCSLHGDRRHLSIAGFLGSPQTPSVWHHDVDLTKGMGSQSLKIPIQLKRPSSGGQKLVLYVSYYETYSLGGIKFRREYQLQL